MTRDVWHAALRPDVSGVAVDALLFHEAGRRLVHRYRVYKDPFPHPALRDGVIPRLLSCVCRAMDIARLTHLRISIPSSGAPPGEVPVECFPGETATVTQPHRRRVSFTDGVTMLGEEDSPECSQLVPPLILPVVVEEAVLVSEAGVLSLILPVVEELNNDVPAAELVEMEPSTSESGFPPPPGFPPFVWPEDDGGWTLMTCVRGSVGQFINIIAYQLGVVGPIGRDGRAGSGCIVIPHRRQFVEGDTGGGLRSLAPAVCGQWFDARLGVGASSPAAHGTVCGS